MDTQVDPEAEVKKLQSLVKKLEKQNELLRSKADGSSPEKILQTPPPQQQNSRVTVTRNKMAIANNCSNNVDRTTTPHRRLENGSAPDKDSPNYSLLDDSVELLESEISEMMNEEDDSWLYVSPLRVLTPEERSINVYDWIRQDLDHPSEEMESAKRSLQAKLDELARAQRNSLGVGPAPLLPQQPVMVDASVGIGRLESSPSPTATSSSSHTSPSAFPYQSATTPRRKSETERRERERRISGGDRKASDDLGYSKLEDVTDVQILAKMQEESLRQAMQQSPSNSPRRAAAGISPATSESALHRPASRSNSGSGPALPAPPDRDEPHPEPHPEGRGKSSDVVRRRPSLERVKKGEGDTRRYSYGAKMAPNNAADNGESITIAELQKLALERQAAHKGSLPNLNRTYTKEMGSPPTAAPQPLPQAPAPAPVSSPRTPAPVSSPRTPAPVSSPRTPAPVSSPRTPAPLSSPRTPAPVSSPRTPAPVSSPRTPAPASASSSRASSPTAAVSNANHGEPSESRLKHPSSPSPTRSLPAKAGGGGSALKQPSPSKMRNASPQRSGIPVRSSASAERSGIPRPRSAIISPRTQMLIPGNRSSLTMPRRSSKMKTDDWREGCY